MKTAPTWMLPFNDPRRLAANAAQLTAIVWLERLAKACGRRIRP